LHQWGINAIPSDWNGYNKMKYPTWGVRFGLVFLSFRSELKYKWYFTSIYYLLKINLIGGVYQNKRDNVERNWFLVLKGESFAHFSPVIKSRKISRTG